MTKPVLRVGLGKPVTSAGCSSETEMTRSAYSPRHIRAINVSLALGREWIGQDIRIDHGHKAATTMEGRVQRRALLRGSISNGGCVN